METYKIKKRKICIITGTRAEYGLFYWLMKEIDNDKDLELQIVVTGMHLSPEFGNTYKEIEKDGFKISAKVDVLLSSDSSSGISKSMGLAMISFAEVLNELKPDLCVILGDRFEIFSVAATAMIYRIPIAHIHGGEATEGMIDEAIRHSITKMSHLHFVANDEYLKRVIQLGENPKTVFNVGSLGVENISRLNLLDRSSFEKQINFKLGKKNFLITYHPTTLEKNTSKKHFEELLAAIEKFKNVKIIFTMPNSDNDGRIIKDMINEYVSKNMNKSIVFKSMGQVNYLSALKHADLVIGNSSSGLIEAPSFNIPTINIGDRQKGRIKAKSVIDAAPNSDSIFKAINKSLSKNFRTKIKNITNPYDGGRVSSKIKKIIGEYNLKLILKKEFYNL
jgi:GDP/UDP-N,N'-diacetylbacillosamine 2-epimerase (hydrolysing)